MREIKFRAIREKEDYLESDEWVYGGIGTCASGEFIIIQDGEPIIVYKETIGEYTGLKDKNETEIYEGDIVKMINYRHKGVIKYINGAFEIDWNDKHLCRNLNYWNKNDSVIEVIGNMFENRELLEENKYE